MITEDYVSFETAKLLKEKGFKGDGSHFYENKNIVSFVNYWNRITPYERYCAIECPTLQMAMKWLREVHNIDIIINVSSKDESDDKRKYTYAIVSKRFIGTDNVKRTYEESCEEAIKYCLENLIEI